MNGGDILGAALVVLVLACWWWLWARARALQRELERIQMEHRTWGAPGEWVCSCGGVRIGKWDEVPDRRGMLHHARRCEPDMRLLGDDV